MAINALSLSTTNPKLGDIIKMTVTAGTGATIFSVRTRWFRSWGSSSWVEATDRENTDFYETTKDDWTRMIKCEAVVRYSTAENENAVYTETLNAETSGAFGIEDVSNKTQITGVALSTNEPHEGDVLTATVTPAGATCVFEWWIGVENGRDTILKTVQKSGAVFTVPNLTENPIYRVAHIGVTAKGYGSFYGYRNDISTTFVTSDKTPIAYGNVDTTDPQVSVPLKFGCYDADNEDVTDSDDVEFQWKRKTGSVWEDIEGANDSTYTPTEDDVGCQLGVEASASDESLLEGEIMVEIPRRVVESYELYVEDANVLKSEKRGRAGNTFKLLSGEKPVVGDDLIFTWTTLGSSGFETRYTINIPYVRPVWYRLQWNTKPVLLQDNGGWAYAVTEDDESGQEAGCQILLMVVIRENGKDRKLFVLATDYFVRKTEDETPARAVDTVPKLKISVNTDVAGIGQTILAQLAQDTTADIEWRLDGERISVEEGVDLSSLTIANGKYAYLSATAVGSGAFLGETTNTATVPIVFVKTEVALAGENGGIGAPQRTAHIRGGRGITITPNGNCNHSSEASKIAKINWDGVQFQAKKETSETDGEETDEETDDNNETETKWFREIAFQNPLTGTVTDVEDKMTIGSKELHFLVKNNGTATIPKHSFIRINGFEETYSNATEAKNDLEDKEVVLSCNTTGSGQYFAYTQEEIGAGGTGYATFPYAPLVFGVVATSSGSTSLQIGSRLSINANSASENALKFIVDANGLFVVVAFDYGSKMVAAFCLAVGTSTSIRYCSAASVVNGTLALTFSTKDVLINE